MNKPVMLRAMEQSGVAVGWQWGPALIAGSQLLSLTPQGSPSSGFLSFPLCPSVFLYRGRAALICLEQGIIEPKVGSESISVRSCEDVANIAAFPFPVLPSTSTAQPYNHAQLPQIHYRFRRVSGRVTAKWQSREMR